MPYHLATPQQAVRILRESGAYSERTRAGKRRWGSPADAVISAEWPSPRSATSTRTSITIPTRSIRRGSCQLTVPNEAFGDVAQWLTLNRGVLTIFAHANTGDDLADHTHHVIWFGQSEPLNLSIFD